MTWPGLLSLQTASPQLLREHAGTGPSKVLVAVERRHVAMRRKRWEWCVVTGSHGQRGHVPEMEVYEGYAHSTPHFSYQKEDSNLVKMAP